MMKKFTASRVSQDNALFPPQIILEDDGVTIKCPGLFSGRSTVVSYDKISHISIKTPLIGFSTISFFIHGEEVSVHGFTQSEAKEIKIIITQKQTQP